MARRRFFKRSESETASAESVWGDAGGAPPAQPRRRKQKQSVWYNRLALLLLLLTPVAFLCYLLIFLIPTDEKEWYDRLRNRKTETPESLALRLKTARQELEYLPEFDYVVVNTQDKLEHTVDTIVAIIEAEHHRVIPRKVSL